MREPQRSRGLVLSLALVGAPAAMAQQPEGMVVKNLSDIHLAVVPGGPTCNVGAVMQGDPAKEASVMIMRSQKGCMVPWHWHPSTEKIMLIKGTAKAEIQGANAVMLQAGGYLSVPPKHPMRFSCPTQCELFLYTDGPFEIHYIDAAGHEISADEALKPAKKTAKP
jgi:quercetin dioxygenase-like cupin family protein